MSWSEVVAGIIANTSMTPKDIGELSYPELEELLDGMSKNAERLKDEMEGVQRTRGDAQDLLEFIGKNGNSF